VGDYENGYLVGYQNLAGIAVIRVKNETSGCSTILDFGKRGFYSSCYVYRVED